MTPRRALLAGVDLGGTKIYTAVATAEGEVLADDRRLTEGEEGPEAVIERIIASLRQAIAEAGVEPSDLVGIGLASPGPIDIERGIITAAPNLPGWYNVPLGRRVSEALGVPARLENDANAAAYGEYRFGAGRGFRHIVYVTLGTGIGGGLILDGRLYEGVSGAAGEVGHMTIDPEGPLCGCGQRGHLEALASGTAIEREAAAAVARGESELLARLAGEGSPSAEVVHQAAQQGDAVACRIIERAGEQLGAGLASLLNIFNPDALILGGGLLGLGDLYLEPARRAARQGAFPQTAADATILLGILGERAGALGAAALMVSS